MDWLTVSFPVSGVQTQLWLPPLVAFVISFFTAMAGVSGAFLLLPFQMSVLHYTAPSVSATNMVFNLVAIPSGAYRYFREGRMVWPLVGVVAAGTLPGVAIGYFIRIHFLPDPAAFKAFVGLVLLYLAWRLLAGLLPRARKPADHVLSMAPGAVVRTLSISPACVRFSFGVQTHSFSLPGMGGLALLVGIVGGIYGIGGGAIIAPLCIAYFGLPVYTVAGAALAATLLTSVFGVMFYSLLPAPPELATRPDWLLGILFGLGGAMGMSAGARMQRLVPEAGLKLLLGMLIAGLAGFYLLGFIMATQAG